MLAMSPLYRGSVVHQTQMVLQWGLLLMGQLADRRSKQPGLVEERTDRLPALHVLLRA